MQLPLNPLEGALLNIADDMQQEQHMGLNEMNFPAEVEVNQDNIDNQQGQADPDNIQLDNEQGAQGPHLQVGMVLVSNSEGDPTFLDWERAKTTEATRL